MDDMAIYLKIDGIEGDVTARGHEGWIECSSIQWGVDRGIQSTTETTQQRKPSAPNVSDVTVTTRMNKTTPLLFIEACVGKPRSVNIDLVQIGEYLQTYMSYKLNSSLITGYSMSTNGDTPMESVSINFTRIEMKYTPYDSSHRAQSPISAGYDISAGKKL